MEHTCQGPCLPCFFYIVMFPCLRFPTVHGLEVEDFGVSGFKGLAGLGLRGPECRVYIEGSN